MVLVQEVNIGLTQPSVNFLDWMAGPNYIRLEWINWSCYKAKDKVAVLTWKWFVYFIFVNLHTYSPAINTEGQEGNLPTLSAYIVVLKSYTNHFYWKFFILNGMGLVMIIHYNFNLSQTACIYDEPKTFLH